MASHDTQATSTRQYTSNSCLAGSNPNASTEYSDAGSELEAFWCRVSELTTRTRNDEGAWVGSPEARQWNERNKESCSRCQRGRNWRACFVENDQLTCLPCRKSKMACDRKTRFIFEYTKDEFFPTMDEFKAVYGKKEHTDCRVYRKWASRKLRESVPYSESPVPLDWRK
ncbi:hypothetical protein R3P38DRAFT_2560389 [Favolaschia claudopus]|uniref:Zn(2)-C6 fungal-type domain-containing protein n=1 Tax=Favolaschia claudopus TaxID=2862362 RepID=A0AAW0A3W5_9AGAR